MKKIHAICFVILFIVLTSACNSNKEVTSQHNSNNSSVSDEKLKSGVDYPKSVLAIKHFIKNLISCIVNSRIISNFSYILFFTIFIS